MNIILQYFLMLLGAAAGIFIICVLLLFLHSSMWNNRRSDTFIASNPAKDIGTIVGVFVGAVIALGLILYGVRALVKRYP